jgi:hypothetical protein
VTVSLTRVDVSLVFTFDHLRFFVIELDRLNQQSELNDDDDDLNNDETPKYDPSMTARAALKHSLQSQMDWMTAQQELQAQRNVLEHWTSAERVKRDVLDHAFEHHVDYRAIAEYESH